MYLGSVLSATVFPFQAYYLFIQVPSHLTGGKQSTSFSISISGGSSAPNFRDMAQVVSSCFFFLEKDRPLFGLKEQSKLDVQYYIIPLSIMPMKLELTA
jgi:hypothetical protein